MSPLNLVLQYEQLNPGKLAKAFARVVAQLETGDFRSAEVKKLSSGGFYRAKLSDADRLLFRFGHWRGQSCLILLEIILNHDYAGSRFLRGAAIDEANLQPLEDPAQMAPEDSLELGYLNRGNNRVHILDKILSFDDDQESALRLQPPLILIGSAGSGKTVLTLEKLRRLPGTVLYLTHSPYLVDNARSIYFAHNYENDDQEVDFLSFRQFVDSISVPEGAPLAFADFSNWFGSLRGTAPVKDINALYEEFNGVISGSAPGQPYLAREEYLGLGVRRSIYPRERRPAIYDLFERYLAFLPGSGLYDLNLVCHSHLALVRPAYDFLVADEVQDMTAAQLNLALHTLHQPTQFVLCGDSNQIVHPNFFSWSTVKTMFYERRTRNPAEIIRILATNYRNSPAVTDIANRILRIKQERFGSIDRESHHLVRTVSQRPGGVTFIEDTPKARAQLNRKTSRSARFAVIVLREEDKASARRDFDTPLVFSVREAKGLEYDHIILPSLISGQSQAFRTIAAGVTKESLEGEFNYNRGSDKGDRTLDAYKFYINALYVAITRAISHVYILENDSRHSLVELLKLELSVEDHLEEQQSSADEWRAEALRLEKQGKLDQSEAIRTRILKMEPVPWEIADAEHAHELYHEVRSSTNRNHKALRFLLDYASVYRIGNILDDIASRGFKNARDHEVSAATALKRYTEDYRQTGHQALYADIERYGVDFRNQMNQTPLMLAIMVGQSELALRLISDGADLTLTDSLGRTPFRLALLRAGENAAFADETLPALYSKLAPAASNFRIGKRLVQVDRHRPEYLLFELMLAHLPARLQLPHADSNPAFTAAQICDFLKPLPDSIVSPNRRVRSYVSSILSGNEVRRDAPRNRQLFLRVHRGYYIPNPAIEFERDSEWINFFWILDHGTLLDLSHADCVDFTSYIADFRDQTARYLSGTVDGPSQPDQPPTVAELPEGSFATPHPPLPAFLRLPRVHTATGVPPVSNPAHSATGIPPVSHPVHPVHSAPATPFKYLRKPRTPQERARYDETISLLRDFKFKKVNALDWMKADPDLGAAVLVAFLEEQLKADAAKPTKKSSEAIVCSILLLASWQAERYFGLIVRALGRVEVSNYEYIHIISRKIGYCLAVCYDGNLALLRDLIADAHATTSSRTTATIALANLHYYRNLDTAHLKNAYRWIFHAGADEGRRNDLYFCEVIDEAAHIFSLLFPELLPEIERAVATDYRFAKTYTLTELRSNASRPVWVRDSEFRIQYGQLDSDIWQEIESLRELSAKYPSYDFFSSRYGSRFNDDYDDYDDYDDDDDPFDVDFDQLNQNRRLFHPGPQVRHPGAAGSSDAAPAKVGRNAPCPCGSGKKYKKCCGR